MRKYQLFTNLIIADIKRLKRYIVPILVSILILLSICTAAALLINKYVYKSEAFTTVNIAYYVPEDDDVKYTNLVTSMLANMQSMQETTKLHKVSTIEQGYDMVESGEAMYLIILPENFLSGVMDSTNPNLTVILKDTSSISAYITNELFLSYSGYLGIAQGANYSMLDTTRKHEYKKNDRLNLQDKVDLVFLDRTLNKEGYSKTIEATNEGNYSLKRHYLASAVMLSLFLLAFVIMPLLTERGDGIISALSIYRIKSLHIFLSNAICCFLALYLAYLPCYLLISIVEVKGLHLIGLLTIIPAILIIALIISFCSIVSRKSILSANMLTLLIAILIAYVGGGILPSAMLPAAIQNFSGYLPGEKIIKTIAISIFG